MRTIFLQSYSLEKSSSGGNPMGAPALGGTPATHSQPTSWAQGTGVFIKI